MSYINEFKTPSLINSVVSDTLPSPSHLVVFIPFSNNGLSIMLNDGLTISLPILSFNIDLPLATFSPSNAVMNV